MGLCDDWTFVPAFIKKDDFVGYNPKDPSGCFRRSVEQLGKSGYTLKSPGWALKMIKTGFMYQTYLISDVGRFKTGFQKEEFENGVAYLKREIQNKVPVMVGVEHHDGSSSGDEVTDHYVTIVGMGTDETGKYFLFYDNATSHKDIGASDKNRIYCDCQNFSLIGTGDEGNSYLQSASKKYIVSQIRESTKIVRKKKK